MLGAIELHSSDSTVILKLDARAKLAIFQYRIPKGGINVKVGMLL